MQENNTSDPKKFIFLGKYTGKKNEQHIIEYIPAAKVFYDGVEILFYKRIYSFI